MLARVNAEIERHVDAVDEAMRAAEADMEHDAAWREKEALRDAALDALDKVVMEREVEVVEEGGESEEWQGESEEEEVQSEAGEGESEAGEKKSEEEFGEREKEEEGKDITTLGMRP